MSKIVYFVVGVDLDTKEVFIDDDTFLAKFGRDELENDEHYFEALEILNTKPIAKDGN